MKKTAEINSTPVCKHRMQGISDTMSLLSGKWKIPILGTLIEGQTLGFMDLMREIAGIGPKMLSRELQDLELNGLITRSVQATKPVTVLYAISEHGESLRPLIEEIARWGIAYRQSLHASLEQE